jgi:hypothetical protein
MHRVYTYPRSLVLGAAAALLVLAICATALAAHPTAGKSYSGNTSAAKANGFSAPISFKVSSNGKQLLKFEYGNTGCIAYPITGDPYTGAHATIIKVGTVAVSSKGSFSVTNENRSEGIKSKISGKFKTANTAAGTIKFTQHETGPGGFNKSCGPIDQTFTATTK